jgi:intracellular septation protein
MDGVAPTGTKCENIFSYTPHRPMKFLFDFFPLLLFFAAFKFAGIYVATAAAIAASIAQVAIYWWRKRRFETMHLITMGVIVVFGGLTLWLHNDTFIKWKPTMLYWIFAALILGSQLGRGKTAMERVMGTQMDMPPAAWKRFNLNWGLFFLAMGALNLYVAFFFALDHDAAWRQEMWVNFKVFGSLALTFLFALAHIPFLSKYLETQAGKGTS